MCLQILEVDPDSEEHKKKDSIPKADIVVDDRSPFEAPVFRNQASLEELPSESEDNHNQESINPLYQLTLCPERKLAQPCSPDKQDESLLEGAEDISRSSVQQSDHHCATVVSNQPHTQNSSSCVSETGYSQQAEEQVLSKKDCNTENQVPSSLETISCESAPLPEKEENLTDEATEHSKKDSDTENQVPSSLEASCESALLPPKEENLTDKATEQSLCLQKADSKANLVLKFDKDKSENQTAASAESTSWDSAALPVKENSTPDKATEQSVQLHKTEESKLAEAAGSEERITRVCQNQIMAAQVLQPSEQVLSTTASTPPGDTSPALGDLTNAPVEDRLSSNESPEPCEDAVMVAGESASPASADAAAASGSKPEAEVKGTTVKTKKKEDKSIEYILRALSSLNSPEEKLAALCKKYADLHEEHRVLQSSFKQQQRKMTVVQREKDQLQAEHTKAVIAKSKLESLCRELQKQNKLVKEESLIRTKEDEERRKELSAKFQTTIADIQAQMTENHERNVKLREENKDLAEKLKKFLEQYELHEKQIEKMGKHRELEQQLADAKLQQAAHDLREEQERNIKEKELILIKATECQQKNTALESQLSLYKKRYEEFQETITKSNDMFQKLKSEMDKMGKRIKKLEKDGAHWRSKWESSNRALIDMVEEKSRSDKEKEVLSTKVKKLESLCRALQGELHGKKTAVPSGADAADGNVVSSTSDESTVPTATPTTTAAEKSEVTSSSTPDSTSCLPKPLPTEAVSACSTSEVVPDSTSEETDASTECSGGTEVSTSKSEGENVPTSSQTAAESSPVEADSSSSDAAASEQNEADAL